MIAANIATHYTLVWDAVENRSFWFELPPLIEASFVLATETLQRSVVFGTSSLHKLRYAAFAVASGVMGLNA
ncbi:hypothetical protein CDV36_015779 [Fusarium kuroshium]|uniref:Uncharacterized protein n=2 Tax=Fusarium solani species complex TaxID=232080 RepID=A0A3M2R882_9HYPO|nr:hypothetical protein CDV36_015779 [Fusarium kuroshium]RSL81218.1 hypothetical protein CDV31_017052 [Fusarium ambrosium]